MSFKDHFTFLRKVIRHPKHVGAIAPSSRKLSTFVGNKVGELWQKNVALPPDEAGIHAASGPYILEIGPGTGAFTEKILQHAPHSRVVCIDIDDEFCAQMRQKFPQVETLQGDARQAHTLVDADRFGRFSVVVSGLPLRNFSHQHRHDIFQSALRLLAPGGHFLQFTYLFSAPYRPLCAKEDAFAFLPPVCQGRVWQNLPPATVWSYEKSRTNCLVDRSSTEALL